MGEKFDLYIVDDDLAVIDIIVDILSDYQVNIKTFNDPLKAYNEVIANPPSVIFIDYNMPIMDAKGFIVKISEQHIFQHSSIFLITGVYFGQLAKIQLQTLGFSRIIEKPFNDTDIISAMEEVIGTLQKRKLSA